MNTFAELLGEMIGTVIDGAINAETTQEEE